MGRKLIVDPYKKPMLPSKSIHFFAFERSEFIPIIFFRYKIYILQIISERCPNLSQIAPQGEEEHIIPIKTTVEIKASLTVDNFHSHLNQTSKSRFP